MKNASSRVEDNECACCHEKAVGFEPRFGYYYCKTHENTPPVDVSALADRKRDIREDWVSLAGEAGADVSMMDGRERGAVWFNENEFYTFCNALVSSVLTEGFVLVPVEPTSEMLDCFIGATGARGRFEDMLIAAPTPPENKAPLEAVAEVVWYDPQLSHFPEKPGKIIDGSIAFMESAEIGTKLFPAPAPPVSEDRKDAERLAAVLDTVSREFYFAEIDAHHPEVHAIRKLRVSLFAKIQEIIGDAAAPEENKP